MNQSSFGFDPLPKKTRKEVFLDEMNSVVPWAELVALIQPYSRGAHQVLGGRPPFPIETMLRIHCLQLWSNLSDPAMEEELHERPLYRRFAGLDGAARMAPAATWNVGGQPFRLGIAVVQGRCRGGVHRADHVDGSGADAARHQRQAVAAVRAF